MNISDADLLMTDLVAAARSNEAHARQVLADMIRETRPGQAWGVLVPARFLDGVTLPNGLMASTPPGYKEAEGVKAIMGVVR